jgi:hypothetical protein
MPSPCVETSPGLEIARACEQKMAAPPMVCPIRTRPLAREGARDHTDRAVGGMYSTNPLVFWRSTEPATRDVAGTPASIDLIDPQQPLGTHATDEHHAASNRVVCL